MRLHYTFADMASLDHTVVAAATATRSPLSDHFRGEVVETFMRVHRERLTRRREAVADLPPYTRPEDYDEPRKRKPQRARARK